MTEAEKAYVAAEQKIEMARDGQAQRLTFDDVATRELATLPESIAKLTALRSLDLDNTQIADLTPLSGLTGLTELRLNSTGVADLTPLSGLTDLTNLQLNGTGLSDLTPLSGLTGLLNLQLDKTDVTDLTSLSGLLGLTALRLNGTGVTDLAPLSGLTGLLNLQLDNTGVTDLTSLSGLIGLTRLDLDNTGVTDLTPLSGLLGLAALRLNGTGVTDLTPLSGLTGLAALELNGTRVTDLTPISGLTSLTTLELNIRGITDLTWLSGLTGLTSLDLLHTGVADLTPLSGLKGLEKLRLNSSSVTDLTPLSGLTDLDVLWLSNTGVTDLTPLSGLTALRILLMNNTEVTDLTPVRLLHALHWLAFDNTPVTDLSPLVGLKQLNDLHLESTAVTDLRPLIGLNRLVDDPQELDGGVRFKGCAACAVDAQIAEIAEIEDDRDRARTLFDYLEGNVLPELLIPAASPAPLMVKMESGRMQRTGSDNLPENDALTRAEMGWVALKAYRDSFGAIFNVHNYAPLPGVLSAFDNAMGEVFDSQRMILIGVMGTRIVNLSNDRLFLNNLPEGAETDLRGFAAQISIFLNRFPDWVTYVEEAESNDATAEAVKAERAAFDEFIEALSETGMVESEVTEEFASEINAATGEHADVTAAKGLTASTRELLRELSEVAVKEVRSGRIVRKDVESMDQIADSELAKLKLWTYGWPVVILKRRQATLRRLANRFPARLGWLGPVLDYLIGAGDAQ